MEQPQEQPQREIYFIVPRKKVPFLDDTRTMQAVAELHTQSPIDAVILHTRRNFPVLREYCGQNLIHRIDVRQKQDRENLKRDLIDGREYIRYKRIACITTNGASLEEFAEKLSEYDFKTEIIELF